MKHLQLIIALFISTALIFSCNPKAKKPDQPSTKSEPMSFVQLSKLIGEHNAFKVFDSSGKTEENPAARGSRKPKTNAVVLVWLNDLTLTMSGGSITYTVSPSAKWGGCQRFPDPMANDGAYAVWSCERYWHSPGIASTVTCADAVPAGVSNYRAFTADHDYQIHISNVVQVSN